jgi:uncharacterized membrane protein HdeD (DUF308 family)
MFEKNSLTTSITAGLHQIHDSWGWFVSLGVALLLLGVLCILSEFTATLATVLAFGWLLLIAAACALVHAVRTRSWGGFFLYLASALLRGVTGYLLIRYPLAGEVGLTLILASFFIVGGVFRAVGAGALRFPNWGWATFSGILSAVLGVILFWQMPVSSLWFIGFAIGIDLIFEGSSLIAVGIALRGGSRVPHPASA